MVLVLPDGQQNGGLVGGMPPRACTTAAWRNELMRLGLKQMAGCRA